MQQLENGKRRIVYAWPTFCRDLVRCSSIHTWPRCRAIRQE
jgi:hypothetical protein